MTTYWRNGFWRASINGNVHWVDGHDVDRNEWSRGDAQQGNPFLLRNVRAHLGTTSRTVVPNAECPVCGSPVFFYQNQHGSRVFFDELGPPWPKHPCTVTRPMNPSGSPNLIGPNSDDLRSQDEFEFIQRWVGPGSEDAFERSYGTLRWDIAVFVTRHQVSDITILVLNTEKGHRYFILDDTVGVPMVEGQLVTYFGNWISYVALDGLEVVELKLQRVGARRLLNHILCVQSLANLREAN